MPTTPRCALGARQTFLRPAFVPTLLAAAMLQAPHVSANDSEVEEILVTALRREASLIDVPDAMTVFDASAIEHAGIARLNDVAALTPNLRFSDDQEVGVGTITIRGVTQNRGIGETPVAFFVDDVSVNNSLLTTQDLFDVEQIEVLRGPQGALFGRNAVAGVINIATRSPTPEFEGYLRSRIADGSDYAVEGAVSGPISDRVQARLAGFWQQRDGLQYNPVIDDEVDYKDSIALRGRASIAISDRVSLDLRYQHADQEGGSGYFMPGSVDNEANRLPGDPFPFPLQNTTYSIQSNLKGRSDVRFDEYTVKFDVDFDGFTLSSISGWNDLKSNNDQDLDQTAQEFINILVDDDATQASQEFRLVSNGEGRLRWLGGVYLSDQTRDRSLATSLNVTGFIPPGGDWSTENAFFVPQPPAVLDESYDTRAVYAQLNVDLASNWEMVLAGRWDRVERTNDSSNPAANGSATFTEFQPKVQLAWSPRDDLNLFATYAEGFRPGGFNTLANAPEVQFGPRFDAETLTNYELGAKYQSRERALSLNASLFYMDYDQQQFFLFDPFGSQALINADESFIAGGEIELGYRPMEGLDLALAYGFTDSEIERMPQAPGLNVPASEIDGSEVPNAPVYTLNLMAEYRRPVAGMEFSSRIDLERRGTTYFTIDNRDLQDPYNTVNLRFGLSGQRWQVTAFADNLLDEDWIEFYFSRRYIGLRTDIAWPSPPRQVGVELRYEF